MTPATKTVEILATYLKRIGQLAEDGDTVTIKREVRLALKICEGKS